MSHEQARTTALAAKHDIEDATGYGTEYAERRNELAQHLHNIGSPHIA